MSATLIAQGIPAFSTKDPTDVDQFTFDVTLALLSGEAVGSALFEVELVAGAPTAGAVPLTAGGATIAGALISASLSGGVINATYLVGVSFVTSQNRSLRRSARLFVARC